MKLLNFEMENNYISFFGIEDGLIFESKWFKLFNIWQVQNDLPVSGTGHIYLMNKIRFA